jgi:MerR family copper efflux transcriptional regulator
MIILLSFITESIAGVDARQVTPPPAPGTSPLPREAILPQRDDDSHVTEVREPVGSSAGARSKLTRRSVAGLLGKGFELLGGMERREVVQMLEAHKASRELVEFVRERVPDRTRVAGLRGLWEHLGDLPLDDGAAPASEEPLLQIGEVADRVGLSLRSVRYYDEAGLVHPSARSDGNFRLYSERDVERLQTVKMMKPFGLSIDEMSELVRLLDRAADPQLLSTGEAAETAAELQAFAERGDQRIARLERDLEQARALRLRLGEHVARCR